VAEGVTGLRRVGRPAGDRQRARWLRTAALAALVLTLPEAALAWWNPAWGLRRKITIDNSGQATNLADFPLLVRLDATRVEYFRTQNAGQDIRFVDADGTTLLAHEIESWNEAGSSYVWVRVPQIDASSTSDHIWMYYDNAAAADGQNAAGVWDASFRGVWHLRENPAGAPPQMRDSTSNANHGTVEFTPVQAAGQVNGSLSYNAATAEHNVNVAHAASLQLATNMTVSGWARTTSVDNQARLMAAKWQGVGNNNYWLGKLSDTLMAFGVDNGPNANCPVGFVNDGLWHHVVGVADAGAGRLRIYVDGVERGNSAYSGTSQTGTSPVFIGRSPDIPLQRWDGGLDEIRVESVARTTEWIRAQNLSMRDSYLSFGPAQCDGGCNGLALSENAGAGTVTLTNAGAFEMTFATSAGGAIQELYDLEEDPGKANDLAGSLVDPTTSSPRGLHNIGMNVGGVFYNASRNNLEARLHLLEATPTRVRAREDSFLQGPAPGNLRLGGVKAYGDYSVYAAGKVALRWNRRAFAAVTYGSEYVEIFVHYLAGPSPLNFWTPFSEAGGFPPSPHPGLDNFGMFQNEQPGARTDVLKIFSKDWTIGNGFAGTVNNLSQAPQLSHERINMFWNDTDSVALAAGASHSWYSLTYFKPTVFVDHADPAVLRRSDDYRGPDTLATLTGGPWNDADENTASDFFNEAEAAYLLTLDPSPGQGLRFRIAGTAAAPRFSPFFKIRYWRSLARPTSVTKDGVPLVSGAGYRADVKPVSRAHFASDLTWYSTLQGSGQVAPPDVGTSATLGPAMTGADFVAGRFGNAARFDALNKYLSIPRDTNLDLSKGAVEFWYQPTTAHDDGAAHRLWGYSFDASNFFMLQKENAAGLDLLRFQITRGGVNTAVTVASTDYSWRASDWVHVRTTWDESAALGNQVRIFLNGVEPVHTDPVAAYVSAGMPTTGNILIGADSNGNRPATGLIDEFRIYSDPSLPAAIAHAGLTADAREYLYDYAKSFPLAFSAVDPQGRGEYAYFGSDSKFHGLNVGLSTAGAGTGLDLAWQFWNGTGWADLEAGLGFTDTTSQLTKSGNVYWTGIPPGWTPYSVNGGPELYYVRARLAAGSYSQAPVEGLITTDILLLQLCDDVTATNEIAIPAPFTTAVTMSSFTASPADGAVDLAWTTASELRNLGFHLYRATSADGPWTRITSSLVPGLGSSALGQAYSHRDAGLRNGTRYFYRLEDVDASSRTTSHGPVSAVPQAASAGGSGERGRRDVEPKRKATAPSCPASVLQAAGADAEAASFTCSRHGDPEAVSLAVVSRDERGALVELRTGGFYALHDEAGRVRVLVPGFELPQGEEAAALPVRRALVEAVVGRRVALGGVRALERATFAGLTPAALGKAEMRSFADGTIRPARRGARRGAGGLPTHELVTLLPAVFQGERKSAALEIAPFAFDARQQRLVLAKRVRVQLRFTGREPGESGRGGVGRAPSKRGPRPPAGEVLARLHTSRPGLHAVAFEEVLPGERRGVALSELKLARQGTAVAFHVEPAGPAFGPGGRLYFHAEAAAASTAFEGEVAYELAREAGGVTMALEPAAPRGATAAGAPVATRSFEVNRFYQPGLLDAEDVWLWEALVAGTTRVVPFSLAGVRPEGSATLELRLEGASESGTTSDHHVAVSVNGVPVGETRFAGKRPHRLGLELPAALLREGDNELQLTNVGDTGVASLVFLDRFSLVHPRATALVAGSFDGAFSTSGAAGLTGAAGPVALVDATPGEPARWLVGQALAAGELRFDARAGRRYLAAADLLRPRVARPEPSTLRAPSNRADYLLISPRAFLAAAQPLVERREAQGLAARAVALEEIAAEFGGGEASAEAVRAFISHAFHAWSQPSPRYVVLLGDASYDPRRFGAASLPAPLPALWTKTSYLWTVSDPLLAAVNGDDALPDLAIGRLPASDLAQAEALVAKLVAWEESGQGLTGRATLVADNPDPAGDFEADVRDVASSVLADHDPELLLLREHGAGLRPRIQASLDEGRSYLGYVGHGGAAVWASENVWNSWDAASLREQSRQPLLVTMNCLNGYFVAPAFDSLAESLVKVAGRGAIAAFSPSGLSLDAPAHQYHKALAGELASGRHARLGDAVLAAQRAYAESGLMPELLGVYHLLGDPATTLR